MAWKDAWLSERLAEIDARGPGWKSPGRNWTVNSQDQTLTIVRGPVEFLMGSPADAFRPEMVGEPEPRQRRGIAHSFAIGQQKVTLAQFRRFREHGGGPDDSPALGVSWQQAAAYCNWLSEQEGLPPDQLCYERDARGEWQPVKDALDRVGYRLPTEAEWEFACRAGATTAYFFGPDESHLRSYAWYRKNTEDDAPRVAQFRPNDLGLFDPLGLAWEWTQDLRIPVEDGRPERICRGGSYVDVAGVVRCAYRRAYRAETTERITGFRVARVWKG